MPLGHGTFPHTVGNFYVPPLTTGPASPLPLGWSSDFADPVLAAAGLLASEQQFSTTPLAPPPPPKPEGWRAALELPQARPAPIADLGGAVPRAPPPTPQGWQAGLDRATPLVGTTHLHFSATWSLPPVSSPAGWQGQADRLIPPAISPRDPFSTFVQAPGAPPNTAVNWQALSPERFTPPFPAAEQQFLALGPEQVPTAPTPWGWWGAQLDYRFAPPFPVVDQQATAHLDFGVPTAPTPRGWQGFQLEARFTAAFPASEQQHAAIGTLPEQQVEPLPTGWRQAWPDYVFARGVLAAVQQFSAGIAEPSPAPTVYGWQSLGAEAIAAVYPAGQQQFSALGLPPSAAPIILPTGGHGDYRRPPKVSRESPRPGPEPAPRAQPPAPAPARRDAPTAPVDTPGSPPPTTVSAAPIVVPAPKKPKPLGPKGITWGEQRALIHMIAALLDEEDDD